MDKVEKYRQTLRQELDKYASRKPVNMPEATRQLIVSGDENQFVLFSIGWHGTRHIHQCLIHVQIKEGKIWVHHDLTDPGLLERLAERGIPEEDLILAFVPEHERVEQEAVLI
jgi:hypothetical protein